MFDEIFQVDSAIELENVVRTSVTRCKTAK